MKRYNFLVFGLILVCMAAIGGLWFYTSMHSSHSVYIDNRKLFDEFTLKKQLEIEYKKTENTRSQMLDSLLLEMRLIEGRPGVSEKERAQMLEFKKQEYLHKQQEFRESNEALTQQYNEQIWKQLNQYVEDYGKQRGYDYIFGTLGNGSIMYANQSKDITAVMIEYVNKRYEGKQ